MVMQNVAQRTDNFRMVIRKCTSSEAQSETINIGSVAEIPLKIAYCGYK
jgi:hypothetical protein